MFWFVIAVLTILAFLGGYMWGHRDGWLEGWNDRDELNPFEDL